MRNSDYIKLYADLFRILEEAIELGVFQFEEAEEIFNNTLKNVLETYKDENM